MYRQIPKQKILEYLKVYKSANLDKEFHPKSKIKSDDDQNYKSLEEMLQATLLSEDQEFSTGLIFYTEKILATGYHLGEIGLNEIQILDRIFDMLRPEIIAWRKQSKKTTVPGFDQQKKWRHAIEIAANACKLSNYQKQPPSFTRQKAHADALLWLKKKGYKYHLGEGSGYQLPKPDHKKLSANIDKKLSRLGGVDTANVLLSQMSQMNKIVDGTLSHARICRSYHDLKREPNIPWNYLYGLCWKNISKAPKRRERALTYDKAVDLAQNLVAAWNLEPYSSYENMELDHQSWLAVMWDVLLYDETMSIPQWQPRSANFLLQSFGSVLQNRLSEHKIELPFGGQVEWKKLAKRICNLPTDSITTILSGELSQSTRNLLKDCSVPADQINKRFNAPFDSHLRNEFSAPFAQLGNGNFIAHPKGVAARAFIEKTISKLRGSFANDSEGVSELDSTILGQCLDDLALKVLCEFGNTPNADLLNQEYTVCKGEAAETDLVLETEDTIFFIECTKKSLTSKSRSGNIDSYIQDFAASFAKNLSQLTAHEANIRTKGCLEYKNGKRLELQNRKIVKIALNLFDHASLQSRMFTIPIVDLLNRVEFNHVDPKMKNNVDKLNKRTRKFKHSINRIYDTNPEEHSNLLREIAMSTYWLSIDQLYYILLKGSGDLAKGLSLFSNVTYQSGDIVFEINSRLGMGKQGNEIVTAAEKLGARLVT